MAGAYETLECEGLTIEIDADQAAPDPRKEWDHVGTMVCFHNRYDLGDEGHGYHADDYDSWAEFEGRFTDEMKEFLTKEVV